VLQIGQAPGRWGRVEASFSNLKEARSRSSVCSRDRRVFLAISLMPTVPQGDHENQQLDSWKEIAVYLNRGVRTVQRWEREEGLPVRRHNHRRRASVYAIPSEVQRWIADRGKDTAITSTSTTTWHTLLSDEELRIRCLAACGHAKKLRRFLWIRGLRSFVGRPAPNRSGWTTSNKT
jgi:hypothetical protein